MSRPSCSASAAGESRAAPLAASLPAFQQGGEVCRLVPNALLPACLPAWLPCTDVQVGRGRSPGTPHRELLCPPRTHLCLPCWTLFSFFLPSYFLPPCFLPGSASCTPTISSRRPRLTSTRRRVLRQSCAAACGGLFERLA